MDSRFRGNDDYVVPHFVGGMTIMWCLTSWGVAIMWRLTSWGVAIMWCLASWGE